MQSLVKLDRPRRVDCLAPSWDYVGEVSFQGYNDTLPSSGTEPRVNNLAVANLHSYLLSCTAASWDISAKSLSQDTTASAQSGNRSTNHTITIRRFNRLNLYYFTMNVHDNC